MSSYFKGWFRNRIYNFPSNAKCVIGIIKFNENVIEYLGKTITFNNDDAEQVDSFGANIFNNNQSEVKQIGWSSNNGGNLDQSEERTSQVLIGSYGTEKDGTSLRGGRGNDHIFAGSGDFINSGWGNNEIELHHNANSQGAKIVVNDNRGHDKISGFTLGYGENSDRMNIGDTSDLRFEFKDGELKFRHGDRRITFSDFHDYESFLFDADEEIKSDTDSGEVVRMLFDTDDGEQKYAVARENSTIRVTDSDSVADIYVGGGKTSALDFDGYGEEILINLSDDSYKNIGIVGGGNDVINNATENDVVNIFNTDLSQITKVEG